MALMSSVPGVKKQVLYGGRGEPPEFIKNSKAIFHFKTIRLLPDGSYPPAEELREHVIDDTRALGSGPFELLIGREFKVAVWEKMVKEMLLGEVARFSCPFQLVSEYPTLSQALRDIKSRREGRPVETHQHRCGFSAMMHRSGHKDLDSLATDMPQLAFEIELLRVEHPGQYKQDAWAMTDSEKTDLVPRLKDEGNTLFKGGDRLGAARKYLEAIDHLESLSLKEKPHTKEWNAIETRKIPFLLNYSQCKLLDEDYADVIRYTTQVLELDSTNVKALYRRGRAYAASWAEPEAIRDLRQAADLDPSLSKSIERELQSLKERLREKDREERERLRGKLFT